MHEDLRRRALESGKTVSNKAKSKPTSRGNSKPNSAANSRAASRIQSRDVSDDEDAGNGNLSDDTNQRYVFLRCLYQDSPGGLNSPLTCDLLRSINSIDQLLESDDFNEQSTEVLRQELSDAISHLLDRKGSNSASRESSLTTYVKCLTSHYLAEGLYGRVGDLLAAFSRSVKAETTEKEATLALRAIALTAITYEDDALYDLVSSLLKRSISDSQSLTIKAAAIYSLAICLSFGEPARKRCSMC